MVRLTKLRVLSKLSLRRSLDPPSPRVGSARVVVSNSCEGARSTRCTLAGAVPSERVGKVGEADGNGINRRNVVLQEALGL